MWLSLCIAGLLNFCRWLGGGDDALGFHQTIGENANGLAGAIFTVGNDGKASKVVLDFYDTTGLGTFVRE